MRVAILCGGLSNERDVSLSSADCIARALRDRGFEVAVLDLFFGYSGDSPTAESIFTTKHDSEVHSVKAEAPDVSALGAKGQGLRIGKNVIEICRMADIVFLALHGDDGENGKLQALLDIYGIKYTGSGYIGSALAMNKGLSKQIFSANGIPTPQSFIVYKEQETALPPWYPCVVKPCSGGSSVGTSIVKSPDDYKSAIATAFKYENSVLVEKFISGREFTVGVLGGKAMPTIEIVVKSGWYDYENKYRPNATEEICPAPLGKEDNERLSKLGEKVYEVLMQEVYSRADFIMDADDGEFYCLEANSLPGMTPTSLVPEMARNMGMSFGELCEKIIMLSMERYEK